MYESLFILNILFFLIMINVNTGIAIINLITCILLAYTITMEKTDDKL